MGHRSVSGSNFVPFYNIFQCLYVLFKWFVSFNCVQWFALRLFGSMVMYETLTEVFKYIKHRSFTYINSAVIEWCLPVAVVELSWSDCVVGRRSETWLALAGLSGAPLGWFSALSSSKSLPGDQYLIEKHRKYDSQSLNSHVCGKKHV